MSKNHVNVYAMPFGVGNYCLVTNKKQAKKVCKHLNLNVPVKEFKPKPNGARTSTVFATDGLFCMVWIDHLDTESMSANLALLAHECMHVVQSFMDEIGETTPSSEFQAYTLQEIYLNLTNDYLTELQKYFGDEEGER